MHLSAIYRYPVKSAAGHSMASARLGRFGIHGDRRWMLVDKAGLFCSQRRSPRLALLQVQYSDQGLRLSFAEESREVLSPSAQADEVPATVWGDSMRALSASTEVNAWLSACLNEDVRLVYCPCDASREIDPAYLPRDAAAEQYVSFADGFPLLVISEASLEDLNKRLPSAVPMNRFRPNLVIQGADPYAEDQWQRLRIGSTELALVKPCSRCAIPSIDQQTALRDPHINRVLGGYRRRNGEIYFGMNAVVIAGHDLTVGDTVEQLA